MTLERPAQGWDACLRELAKATGYNLDQDAAARLGVLLDLVVSWNRKLDLTAARDARALVDLMLADALVIASETREPRDQAQARRERWVDVGSGAGAPGFVLAMLLPNIDFLLVEPLGKRVAFLRTAIGTLGTKNVELCRVRSDTLSGASADVAVSRATLPPPAWLAEGARLATRSVWVLLADGDAPVTAGWHAALDRIYTWPLTGAPRRAIRYVPEGTKAGPPP